MDCIIIVGATATGKSGLAISLAKALNGEIINADSQQLIKNLNIGTAKTTTEEMENIPHHLIDIIEVGQDFSASEFRTNAMAKIKEIKVKNKLPIIVGGTGFYINSLIYNYTFGNASKDENLRQKYNELAKTHGNEYVYNILKSLDEDSAKLIHSNDIKKVIRAIEICSLSGMPKSSQVMSKNEEIRPIIIGLNADRELLYDRINKRVDLMIKEGLQKETDKLNADGIYDLNYQLPIGYSEWKEYYENKISLTEVIDKIKLDTRHYAKRQITWFKKLENVHWIDITDKSSIEIKNEALDIIKNSTLK